MAEQSFLKNAYIPVAVPPVSNVLTEAYTDAPLARVPFRIFTVKVALPAPSLTKYVVELNPIVTPDTELKYVIPVGFQTVTIWYGTVCNLLSLS